MAKSPAVVVMEHIAHLQELTDLEPLSPGREFIARAKTREGIDVVLKCDRKVNLHEVALMETARKVATAFQVPRIITANTPGTYPFIVREFIDKPHLNALTIDNVGNSTMVNTLTDIAKEYSQVLAAYRPTQRITDVQAKMAMARFLAAVCWWETQLLRTNPASATAFKNITRDLVKLYYKYGTEWFGYAHGDIHAEHVLCTLGEKPYLLDLNAQIKPGKGHYDQVRALDSCLAHSLDPETLKASLYSAIKELEEQYGPKLVRPLIKARMLAIATDIEKDRQSGKNMPDTDSRRRLSRAFFEATS